MVRAGAITGGGRLPSPCTAGASVHGRRARKPYGRRLRTRFTANGDRTAGDSAHGSPRTETVRPASSHTVHHVRGAAQYTVTPYADSASVTGWWMAEPEVPEQPELPEWMPRATEPAKCAPPLSPPAEQAVVRTML
ncbi:hypothetical protein SCALM49S_01983 [Streptomyces californicus]